MAGRLDPQTRLELKQLFKELGPDTLLLLVSNLTVIVMALVQGWNIVPLLWIYWCQNIIIGIFNWRRMRQLVQFSTDGLRINGRLANATEKTKNWITQFFLLHFGTFHLFYLIFLLTITEQQPLVVVLSGCVGISFFLFNHYFSYRYNLEKDLSSRPNIGVMSFFPYARVIPMHLVIFIGLQFGRGSKTELFFFLLLKTAVDLLLHVIQHIDWKKPENTLSPSLMMNNMLTAQKKNKAGKSAQNKIGQQTPEKRMTLKERLKLWFLLSIVAVLILAVVVSMVMKEFNN